MPDHRQTLVATWNDLPNPTRDAQLALFGITVIVTVFLFFVSVMPSRSAEFF